MIRFGLLGTISFMGLVLWRSHHWCRKLTLHSWSLRVVISNYWYLLDVIPPQLTCQEILSLAMGVRPGFSVLNCSVRPTVRLFFKVDCNPDVFVPHCYTASTGYFLFPSDLVQSRTYRRDFVCSFDPSTLYLVPPGSNVEPAPL